jgi:hypothetical protein
MVGDASISYPLPLPLSSLQKSKRDNVFDAIMIKVVKGGKVNTNLMPSRSQNVRRFHLVRYQHRAGRTFNTKGLACAGCQAHPIDGENHFFITRVQAFSKPTESIIQSQPLPFRNIQSCQCRSFLFIDILSFKTVLRLFRSKTESETFVMDVPSKPAVVQKTALGCGPRNEIWGDGWTLAMRKALCGSRARICRGIFGRQRSRWGRRITAGCFR